MSERQIVVFTLGNEFFGADISKVREIVRMREVTSVPGAPDFVRGIVNLRGVIVPIVGLRRRFSMASSSDVSEEQSKIVIVNISGQQLGILVDGVSEILRVSEEMIEPAPSIAGDSISEEFVIGIAKVESQLILLLDLERLFSNEEKKELEELVRE